MREGVEFAALAAFLALAHPGVSWRARPGARLKEQQK
jgi:hypothetical protein